MSENLLEVGVDPNYWYPVSRETEVKNGVPMPVQIWGKRMVVYRTSTGQFTALDDRCAHRKVALSKGTLRGCEIVCPYHGWGFGPDGRCSSIPYWPPNQSLPGVKLGVYPVRLRDGILWVFPGNPDEAARVAIPDASDVHENPDWVAFKLDRLFKNHFAIGVINGMDYYHFHLHRKYQPWSRIAISNVQRTPESVSGEYKISTKRGFASNLFRRLINAGEGEVVENTLRVYYHYPHHKAEIGDEMRVWVFFQPMDAFSVKVFITMYIRARGISRIWRTLFQPAFHRLVLDNIQEEDAWIGELEQQAWTQAPYEDRCEINPISSAVQQLIVHKWKSRSENLVAIDSLTV